MLSILGKTFSRQHFEIFFSNFPPEALGDNFHEMSVYFLGKIRKNINLSSAESARE